MSFNEKTINRVQKLTPVRVCGDEERGLGSYGSLFRSNTFHLLHNIIYLYFRRSDPQLRRNSREIARQAERASLIQNSSNNRRPRRRHIERHPLHCEGSKISMEESKSFTPPQAICADTEASPPYTVCR